MTKTKRPSHFSFGPGRSFFCPPLTGLLIICLFSLTLVASLYSKENPKRTLAKELAERLKLQPEQIELLRKLAQDLSQHKVPPQDLARVFRKSLSKEQIETLEELEELRRRAFVQGIARLRTMDEESWRRHRKEILDYLWNKAREARPAPACQRLEYSLLWEGWNSVTEDPREKSKPLEASKKERENRCWWKRKEKWSNIRKGSSKYFP